MSDSLPEKIEDGFECLAAKVSKKAGSFWAFGLALGLILVWAACGPLFNFSETWQLVINTSTTIITFLMVFVIQHSQNKDTRAMQLKLDELISAIELASNRLIDVEDLSERELDALAKRFATLSREAKSLDSDPGHKPSKDAKSNLSSKPS